MSKELELAPREAQPLAVREPQALTIERMYEAVRSGEITADKLAVMKDLLELDARRQFADALMRVQAELPIIEATTAIKNRGKYAKFEHIMAQIQPVLSKHSMSVSFRQSIDGHRIVETCILKHRAGFFTEHPFAVRPGGQSDSETQADCKASTTAKRNALRDALNIVITQDCLLDGSDATMEGKNITPAQAEDIEKRLRMLNKPAVPFLKWADAATFAEIRVGRMAEIEAELQKAERLAIKNLGK